MVLLEHVWATPLPLLNAKHPRWLHTKSLSSDLDLRISKARRASSSLPSSD